MLVKHILKGEPYTLLTWSTRLCVLGLIVCGTLSGSCKDSMDEVVRHKNAGDDAYVRSDYSEAERQYQAALRKAERTGVHNVTYMICLRSLAQVYVAQGRTGEAEATFKRRVELLGEPPADPSYASTVYDDLATFYILSGRVTEAKPLYQRAILLTETAYGTEDPKLREKLEYYVQLLKAKNYQAEALELQKKLDSKKLSIRLRVRGAGVA